MGTSMIGDKVMVGHGAAGSVVTTGDSEEQTFKLTESYFIALMRGRYRDNLEIPILLLVRIARHESQLHGQPLQRLELLVGVHACHFRI